MAGFGEKAQLLAIQSGQQFEQELGTQIAQTNEAAARAEQAAAQIVQQIKDVVNEKTMMESCAEVQSREEQLARNTARAQSLENCKTAMASMAKLLEVHQEPANILARTKANVCKWLDDNEKALAGIMSALSSVRKRTEEQLVEEERKLEELSQQQKEQLVKVQAVHLELCQCANTVFRQQDEENAKLKQSLDQELHRLQNEQSTFVKANESPTKNARFRQTLDLIEKTKNRKRDHQMDEMTRSATMDEMDKIGNNLAARVGNETEVKSQKRRRVSAAWWPFGGH